ncbi:MAG: hypothetical protein HY318_07600 [Armatimonadetes bacterium]|nr:hypothetical protein [Armatimonadota bacterium]
MVISQTPVRISFLGGGTDYPEYFRKHGGATLVAAIDRYTVVTVHHLSQFSDHSLKVHYSKVEAVESLDAMEHPSARECLRLLGMDKDLEIHYVSNLPARTGLGSSSSSTVGLLHALHAFRGEMVSRVQLAQEAVYVEQHLIGERVGCQDQYACALGGFLRLEFRVDSTVNVDPLILPASRLQELQERLLLLYTGVQRNAHELLSEQIARTESEENAEALSKLKALVQTGLAALTGAGPLREFGELLDEGWVLKRRLSTRISGEWIDNLYHRARKAGAVGGKLLGAGGGGFLLLFVEPDRREAVKEALPDLQEATFSFENEGSRIIFYHP